jgi:aminoglycoside/choline kinase family phosphotransferase
MLKQNKFYFIDFQGGRIGPVQYDLASLLIDPYVALPDALQDQLADYCAEIIQSEIGITKDTFLTGYRYCRITRNLQILGAFGYLTRVKGKRYFEQYIPKALKGLQTALNAVGGDEFPNLTKFTKDIILWTQ